MYYDSFSAPGTGLSTEQFHPFFSAAPAMTYKKGQLIYLQGQPPEYLYCLKAGTVRTVIFSDQGEEKPADDLSSGQHFRGSILF